MSGGIGNWSMSMQTARRRRSIASIRSTCSTRAAPPGNRKESCIPQAVIWSAFTRPPSTSSTFAMKIFFGAPRMSAGSPVTVTLFMVRWPMGRRPLCMKARRTGQSPIASGRSSNNIASTFSTPLRLLGTVGEPINPEAWMWYHKNVGGGRCPIVDTWWQTETGSILITPLPGAIPTKPGSATLPFFGVDPAIVDEKGHEVGPNVGGKLIIRRPWPAMLRTIYGDKARYRQQYWSEFKGNYLTGDGARRD